MTIVMTTDDLAQLTNSGAASLHSYWLDNAEPLHLPRLEGESITDVAIVGGGIAGISAAYRLTQAGLRVAVLEKNEIASGTTGGTTGKVTTQHGVIYQEIAERFGTDFGRQYGKICHQALTDMRQLVQTQNIDCDWHDQDNYVYTTRKVTAKRLQAEAAAASAAGLPASYETSLDLPFAIVGAVHFANQAYFNAVKYVRSLAQLILASKSAVYEQSEVKSFNFGSPNVLSTAHGMLKANTVIFATKVPPAPLAGRLTYAAYEYPVTSYLLAAAYDGNLQGMYISPDKSHYSLLPIDTPHGRYLLVGGQSHIPGLKRPEPNHRKLARYGHEHFGISTVGYRWKAMDYIAYDNLPLIGHLYPHTKSVYAIGGFKKWGLNLSMVAANVLTDAIARNDNRGIDMFSPQRLSAPLAIPRAVLQYFS